MYVKLKKNSIIETLYLNPMVINKELTKQMINRM